MYRRTVLTASAEEIKPVNKPYLCRNNVLLNELNVNSSLPLTKFSIPLSLRICMTSYLFSLLTVTTYALHFVTLIKPSSSLKVTHRSFWHGLTSSLEPASYITQNSSSELLIPLSATFIWRCRFNLLHTAITFHHFFTVSLWAENLPFQKILSSTLVFCLSDWCDGSRPFTGLICSSVLCFSSIFSVLVIPKCSRLSWPTLWSTFRRTIK